jgi:hypothetical protein
MHKYSGESIFNGAKFKKYGHCVGGHDEKMLKPLPLSRRLGIIKLR